MHYQLHIVKVLFSATVCFWHTETFGFLWFAPTDYNKL